MNRPMHRIATAILIVAAVLALNGGMLRDALAEELAVQPPAATRRNRRSRSPSKHQALEPAAGSRNAAAGAGGAGCAESLKPARAIPL